jgi:hypothetical protein
MWSVTFCSRRPAWGRVHLIRYARTSGAILAIGSNPIDEIRASWGHRAHQLAEARNECRREHPREVALDHRVALEDLHAAGVCASLTRKLRAAAPLSTKSSTRTWKLSTLLTRGRVPPGHRSIVVRSRSRLMPAQVLVRRASPPRSALAAASGSAVPQLPPKSKTSRPRSRAAMTTTPSAAGRGARLVDVRTPEQSSEGPVYNESVYP